MATFTSDLKRYNLTLKGFRAVVDWWKRHGWDLARVPRRGWRLFRILAPNGPGSRTTVTLWLNDSQLERCFDEPYSFCKELGAIT